MHGLHQYQRIGRDGFQFAVHAQKDESGFDGPGFVKPEKTVLICACGLELFDDGAQIIDKFVQPGHFGQFIPVPKKEPHEIGSKFRVRFRHFMIRQNAQRFNCAFDHSQRFVFDSEYNRHNWSAPTRKQERVITAREQGLDVFGCHDLDSRFINIPTTRTQC